MGWFLGFTDEHTSLAAKVRNLRTGYVGPQFHVVFDDFFQTVFSSGEYDLAVDAICNHLFKSNQDLYDEDEFSAKGELCY